MRKIVVGVLAVAALAGCETKPIEQMGYAERQELVNKLIARCEAIIPDRNHPQFGVCMEAEIEKEVYTRHANREAIKAMGEAGEQMQRQQAMYQSRMTTTNCTPMGRSVHCTTW